MIFELIMIGFVLLIVVAFIIYIIWSYRGRKKRLDELKTIIQKAERGQESYKRSAEAEFEVFLTEEDPEKAMFHARHLVYSLPGRGIEAVDHMEVRFGDRLSENDRRRIVFYRSMAYYNQVRYHRGGLVTLEKARKMAVSLIGDPEFNRSTHDRLDLEEHIRHIALERQILRGS